MKNKKTCLEYIRLLQKGNNDDLIKLFIADAIVDSPIYGVMPAQEFYKKLKEDTKSSNLTIHGQFEDKTSGNIALYFNYKWILQSQKEVNFDVVDIIEFDTSHKIKKLKIIYDTFESRKLIDELKVG